MRFNVITIFPDLFNSFLNESLIKKALDSGLIEINIINLRDFTEDKHKRVDDRPFGGGPGMVLMVEPVYKALQQLEKTGQAKTASILLTPTGRQLDQDKAEELSRLEQITLIAGRYEGVDARIDEFILEKLSIGPYITNGGELPAMITIEAIARLLPGFVSNQESLKPASEDKISVISQAEYPVYTRPEVFTTRDGLELKVPPELLSGDHAAIKQWRTEHSSQ
jgi:tRNA (guanine37-N1)-methyltransferase